MAAKREPMDVGAIGLRHERQLRIARDVGACVLRECQQRGVESPPVQLQAFAVQLEHEIVRVRRVVAPERERAVADAMVVGNHAIQRTEFAQQMTRRGRQTFADLERRSAGSVHGAGIGQQHAVARARQYDRGGGPGRAAASDGDIVGAIAHRVSRVCGRDVPAAVRRWRLPANRSSRPPAACAPSDAT